MKSASPGRPYIPAEAATMPRPVLLTIGLPSLHARGLPCGRGLEGVARGDVHEAHVAARRGVDSRDVVELNGERRRSATRSSWSSGAVCTRTCETGIPKRGAGVRALRGSIRCWSVRCFGTSPKGDPTSEGHRRGHTTKNTMDTLC
mgnify:CR=1 FL=1